MAFPVFIPAPSPVPFVNGPRPRPENSQNAGARGVEKPTSGMRKASKWGELGHLTRDFTDAEIEPLLFAARRIAEGRERYGALDIKKDRRRLLEEAAAEASDLLNYLIWELQKDAERTEGE